MTGNKGQNKPFKLPVYQSNRGRGQTRCNFDQRRYQGRFRSNNVYRGNSRYNQDYRGMILTIDIVTGIIQEVSQGTEGIIIVIMEEVVIEIKITTEIGVGHMKDRVETKRQ